LVDSSELLIKEIGKGGKEVEKKREKEGERKRKGEKEKKREIQTNAEPR
jgi:hypothetical protein